jgi:hypothetical protein
MKKAISCSTAGVGSANALETLIISSWVRGCRTAMWRRCWSRLGPGRNDQPRDRQPDLPASTRRVRRLEAG